MNATTQTTDRTVNAFDKIPVGDLLLSTLHGRYVRFVRWEYDGMAAVCDRNTLKELPDLVHATQLRRC